MHCLVGWLALGTEVVNHRLVEPKPYARPPVTFDEHPNTSRTPRVASLEEPRTGLIRFGAVMDAVTQGRCLAYWEWLPEFYEIGVATAAFPYCDLMINLEYRLQLATNSARADRPFSITIDQGSVIGSVNGRPLIAGSKLGVEPVTGTLISTAAAAKAAVRIG